MTPVPAPQVEARQRFLREVVGGQLVLSGRARPDVAAELWARGYPVFGAIPVPAPPPLPVAVAAAEHLFEPGAWAVPPACVSAAASAPAPPPDAPSPLLALPVVRAAAPPAPLSRAFDYLLGLPLGQLTSDAMGRSAAAAAALRARAQAVAATHPVDVWLAELAALERGLDELDGPALGSAASARPSRG